jgi:hypothetical protein
MGLRVEANRMPMIFDKSYKRLLEPGLTAELRHHSSAVKDYLSSRNALDCGGDH